jgi:hypothetical protein
MIIHLLPFMPEQNRIAPCTGHDFMRRHDTENDKPRRIMGESRHANPVFQVASRRRTQISVARHAEPS